MIGTVRQVTQSVHLQTPISSVEGTHFASPQLFHWMGGGHAPCPSFRTPLISQYLNYTQESYIIFNNSMNDVDEANFKDHLISPTIHRECGYDYTPTVGGSLRLYPTCRFICYWSPNQV